MHLCESIINIYIYTYIIHIYIYSEVKCLREEYNKYVCFFFVYACKYIRIYIHNMIWYIVFFVRIVQKVGLHSSTHTTPTYIIRIVKAVIKTLSGNNRDSPHVINTHNTQPVTIRDITRYSQNNFQFFQWPFPKEKQIWNGSNEWILFTYPGCNGCNGCDGCSIFIMLETTK